MDESAPGSLTEKSDSKNEGLLFFLKKEKILVSISCIFLFLTISYSASFLIPESKVKRKISEIRKSLESTMGELRNSGGKRAPSLAQI